MNVLEKKLRKEFGVYLRNKRLSAGLTQADIADSCDLSSAQFISNIERGLCSIPPAILATMSIYYKIKGKEIAVKYNKIDLTILESEIREQKSS